MQTIAPKIVYLDRRDWGANPSLPRLGHIVPNDKRIEMIHHHDVIVDDDLTKNIWEDIGEVKRGMRRLQTIRPDLGDDVPYNFVFFAMSDGSAILCEGRGFVRTGAHTIGHNTSGIAVCWHGNTMLPVDMSKWTTHLSHAWGWLKYDKGLSRLGSVVTGHRDYYATACPGDNLYAALADITPTRYRAPAPPQEDEMKLRVVKTAGPAGTFWWLTTHPFAWRMWITNLAYMDYMQKKQDWPAVETISGNEQKIFNGLPRLSTIPPK